MTTRRGNPDRHYQRFQKPKCQCESGDHGHVGPCGSRKYLVVHHKDEKRQDQDPSNLITLCSSCHRKEHRHQAHYFGRADHKNWAEEAREQLQKQLLLKGGINGNSQANQV